MSHIRVKVVAVNIFRILVKYKFRQCYKLYTEWRKYLSERINRNRLMNYINNNLI